MYHWMQYAINFLFSCKMIYYKLFPFCKEDQTYNLFSKTGSIDYWYSPTAYFLSLAKKRLCCSLLMPYVILSVLVLIFLVLQKPFVLCNEENAIFSCNEWYNVNVIDYFSKVTVNQYITLVIESNSNYDWEHANVIVIWCIIFQSYWPNVWKSNTLK